MKSDWFQDIFDCSGWFKVISLCWKVVQVRPVGYLLHTIGK